MSSIADSVPVAPAGSLTEVPAALAGPPLVDVSAGDLVRAIKIEPGTLVVFGDVTLDPDPDTDRLRFTELVEAIRQVVGHDQWLALRLHEGAVVGSYALEDVLAALRGSTTQEGTTHGQPLDHPHRDSGHA